MGAYHCNFFCVGDSKEVEVVDEADETQQGVCLTDTGHSVFDGVVLDGGTIGEVIRHELQQERVSILVEARDVRGAVTEERRSQLVVGLVCLGGGDEEAGIRSGRLGLAATGARLPEEDEEAAGMAAGGGVEDVKFVGGGEVTKWKACRSGNEGR